MIHDARVLQIVFWKTASIKVYDSLAGAEDSGKVEPTPWMYVDTHGFKN